jgi:hypothetical protein
MFCIRNPALKLDEGLRRVKEIVCVVQVAPRCVATACGPRAPGAGQATPGDEDIREGLSSRAATTA